MSEKQLEIKEGKYLNIRIDMNQLHEAFLQMCSKARVAGIEDTLLLSYHLCDMTPERQKAQALLYTVYLSEFDGRVKADFDFNLQNEYTDFLKEDQTSKLDIDIKNTNERWTK